MPPVTPNAISTSLSHSIARFTVDFFHLIRDDFLERDGRLFVVASRDARRGPGEQLTRTRAGHDHELEAVVNFAFVNHGCPSCYSTFWTCSRIFSSSAFAPMMSSETRRPSALLPIVF